MRKFLLFNLNHMQLSACHSLLCAFKFVVNTHKQISQTLEPLEQGDNFKCWYFFLLFLASSESAELVRKSKSLQHLSAVLDKCKLET